MTRPCPQCGGDVDPLTPVDEMTPTPSQFVCRSCQLEYRSDPTGFLLEVDP